MKLRFRLRAARRRAVLRMLNGIANKDRASAPKTANGTSLLDPQQFSECTGKAYLIGPGTFLVAAYLQRMERESLCKKKN